MRRLTIGQRNDDCFEESFYYTLSIIHNFHLRILCFITCSDIFIVFYHTAIQNVFSSFVIHVHLILWYSSAHGSKER